MRASLWCLGTALVILAGLAGRASASTSGQITINLMDFAGGGIGPGAQVEGDLWGVSRPKGGSGYTWHHLRKDATATAGGSAVTWTTGEIDAAVDLDANDFWFAVTGWGGSPFSNSQIDSLDGKWSTFILYDPDLPAQTWDVRTSPDSLYEATPTATGLVYDLDLQGTSPPAIWSSAYISYEGCAHDAQPVVSAPTKTLLESMGYQFDESKLASHGLLRITHAGRGYDETVSARPNGVGGYIVELEYAGAGATTYDPATRTLKVDIDFASLGLGPGARYFNRIGFVIEENISPDYAANGYGVDLWFTSGYFGSVLDVQQTPGPVPEPVTAGLVGAAALGLLARRRRYGAA